MTCTRWRPLLVYTLLALTLAASVQQLSCDFIADFGAPNALHQLLECADEVVLPVATASPLPARPATGLLHAPVSLMRRCLASDIFQPPESLLQHTITVG